MPPLEDLHRILLARIERQAPDALAHYGEALAAAIAEAAPVDTGALRASVRYEPESDSAGVIVLLKRGIYVDQGHRVARWGTSARPRSQSRPFKTGGRVPPNPFIARALASAAVQSARARLVALLSKG